MPTKIGRPDDAFTTTRFLGDRPDDAAKDAPVPVEIPPYDTGLEFEDPDPDALPLAEALPVGAFHITPHPDKNRFQKEFALRQLAAIDAERMKGNNRLALVLGENYWRYYEEEFSWPLYLYLSEVAARMCLLLDPVRDGQNLKRWHERLKDVYSKLSEAQKIVEARIKAVKEVLATLLQTAQTDEHNNQAKRLQAMRAESQDIRYYSLVLYYIDRFFDLCAAYLKAAQNPLPPDLRNIRDQARRTDGNGWQFEEESWQMFRRHMDAALGVSSTATPAAGIGTHKTGPLVARIADEDSLPVAVARKITGALQSASTNDKAGQSQEIPAVRERQRLTPAPSSFPRRTSETLISLEPGYITALRIRAKEIFALLKRAVDRMDAVSAAERNTWQNETRTLHRPTAIETARFCPAMQRGVTQALEKNDQYLVQFKGVERERSPLVFAVELSRIRNLIDLGRIAEMKREGDKLLRELHERREFDLLNQLYSILGYGFLIFAQNLLVSSGENIGQVAGEAAEQYHSLAANSQIQTQLLRETQKFGIVNDTAVLDRASYFIDLGIAYLRAGNKRLEPGATGKPAELNPDYHLMRRFRNQLLLAISLKLRINRPFPQNFQNGDLRKVIYRATLDLEETPEDERTKICVPRLAEVLYWAAERRYPKFQIHQKLLILNTARAYCEPSLRFIENELALDPIDEDAIESDVVDAIQPFTSSAYVPIDGITVTRQRHFEDRGVDLRIELGTGALLGLPEAYERGIELDPDTLGPPRRYYRRSGVPAQYFYLLHERRVYLAWLMRYRPTQTFPSAVK